MTDEEYYIRRKYENRNLMQELQWVSRYPPSGMSNQDKDFIRWLAMTAYDKINKLKRKTGEWIHTGGKISRDKTVDRRILTCSICGNMLSMEGVNAGRGDANFCPNCGADMRGDDDGT